MMNSQEILVQSLIDEGYLKTPRLIEAFRQIDRTDFVLPEHKAEAYGNYPLPIGEEQTISQPLTVAFMLELLDPRPGEKILDIGAGSGWQTALLAHAVCTELSTVQKGKVIAIERISSLCAFARQNLEKYGLISGGAVELYCQDATAAIPGGPYDKIIAAAAASKNIPAVWREALKIGGRIVAPVGGSVWVFEKKSKTEWEEKEYAGFMFVPLVRNPRGSRSATLRGRQESGIRNQGNERERKNTGLSFLVLASCFLIPISVFAYEIYLPHSPITGAKEVSIAPGMGSRKIAVLLKQEGVIRSKWAFMIYVALKRQAYLLKPGSYILANQSIAELTPTLVAGVADDLSITIPEGWGSRDIGEYLERQGIGSAARLNMLVSESGSDVFPGRFDFLRDKPSYAGLEGYLFPDTYRTYRDAAPEDVILKMLENFDLRFNPELRLKITGQGKTIFEVITMASLIEKEVISDEDRALISGIFWKRLEAGIPLQVDATITYLTGKKTARVSREETQIDSPYNTYKYRGLPQGPIANPGLSAIRAAIYPKPSSYLYYLSAPDGRTIFSRTLKEHDAAKVKYLR